MAMGLLVGLDDLFKPLLCNVGNVCLENEAVKVKLFLFARTIFGTIRMGR